MSMNNTRKKNESARRRRRNTEPSLPTSDNTASGTSIVLSETMPARTRIDEYDFDGAHETYEMCSYTGCQTQTEATKYCIQCNMYMCSGCISRHNSKVCNNLHHLTDHLPGPVSVKTIQVQHREVCTLHIDRYLEKYCCEHAIIVCEQCVHENHRDCTLQTIEQLLIQTDLGGLKKSYIKQMKIQLKYFTNLCNTITSNKKCLKADADLAIKEVNDVTQILIKYIKDNNQSITDDIKAKVAVKVSEYDNVFHKCQTKITDITHSIRTLAEPSSKVESKQKRLINLMKQPIELEKNYSIFARMKKEVQFDHINFLRNENLCKQIKNEKCNSIGTWKFERTENVTIVGLLSSKSTSDTSAEPCISSMTLLNNGFIVLVDSKNNMLKLATHTYNSIQTIDTKRLEEQPWGVAAINDMCVIVTLPSKLCVQFWSIKDKLLHKSKEIAIGEECTDALVINGEIFLLSGNENAKLFAIDLEGRQKRQITCGMDTVFKQPNYMCKTMDSRFIYITDYDMGVYVIKVSDLTVVAHHRDRNSCRLLGLATDFSNNVYACSHTGRSIHRFNTEEHEPPTVLKARGTGELDKAQYILFIPQNDEFLISVDGSYELLRIKPD